MIKYTGLAILLGLASFALGTGLAWFGDAGARPSAALEPESSALRHITQLPPSSDRDARRSGR